MADTIRSDIEKYEADLKSMKASGAPELLIRHKTRILEIMRETEKLAPMHDREWAITEACDIVKDRHTLRLQLEFVWKNHASMAEVPKHLRVAVVGEYAKESYSLDAVDMRKAEILEAQEALNKEVVPRERELWKKHIKDLHWRIERLTQEAKDARQNAIWISNYGIEGAKRRMEALLWSRMG